jgi:hypothetical protein
MDHMEKYEEVIIQSYEDGKWISTKELDRLKKYYAQQAKNSLSADKA